MGRSKFKNFLSVGGSDRAIIFSRMTSLYRGTLTESSGWGDFRCEGVPESSDSTSILPSSSRKPFFSLLYSRYDITVQGYEGRLFGQIKVVMKTCQHEYSELQYVNNINHYLPGMSRWSRLNPYTQKGSLGLAQHLPNRHRRHYPLSPF